MPANPEVQIKALEKKMSVYDKKFDQYDKQFRQVDYDALVKKLNEMDKKVKGLEKMLFTVASSLKDVKDPSKLMAKAGALDKDAAAKLSQAIAIREAEKMAKNAQKESEETLKKYMATVDKMNIDVRLKVLEGQIKSLGR